MRVLLINPSRIGRFYIGQPKYYADNMAVFPPLSLLPLVSYIHKESEHEVRVLDMALSDTTLDDLKREIDTFEPGLVGATCVITQWYSTVQILNYIKQEFPQVKTVVGGYNCSVFPAETLSHDCIDYMVLGTGQEPLLELLDQLESGNGAPESIGGLFPRDSDKRNFDEEYARRHPDLYPMPDRACLPYHLYSSAISQRFPSTVMISSEGCPYRCNFCNTGGMRKVMMRDPEKVVDEMEDCVRLGISEIMFQDELFTAREDRVLAICEEIERRKLDVCWNFKSRVNMITDRMVPALKRAGCTNIHFGVENGNDEILEQMNKGITTDQARSVFKSLRKHGLDGSASFMLAYPGETVEQIKNTIRFAVELNPAFAQFSVTVDYPGTKVYLDNLAAGKYEEDVWKRFMLDPEPGFQPPMSSQSIGQEQAQELLHSAYRRFYFRLGYITKRLRRIRNVRELMNQARIGCDMLLKGRERTSPVTPKEPGANS